MKNYSCSYVYVSTISQKKEARLCSEVGSTSDSRVSSSFKMKHCLINGLQDGGSVGVGCK